MSFENLLNFQINFKRLKSILLSKEEVTLFNNLPKLNLRAFTFNDYESHKLNEDEINKILSENDNLPNVKKIGDIYNGNNI